MRRIFLCLLAVFLAFPASADPVLPPQAVEYKGLYDCSLSGLVFAHIGIEASQTESRYSAVGDIALTGAISLFVKHSSHSTVTATGKDFSYPDIAYESHYKTNNKLRFVSLTYRNGELSDEKLVPPENYNKRPKVPQNLKGTAADPLTLILEMRQKLIEALRTNSSDYRINVYDGRRLTEVNFTVMGRRSYSLNGTDIPALVVMVRRKLLDGFTKDELADYDKDEPPLYVYFSDDASLWPVRLETHMPYGTLAATLVKQCGAGESCLLGISD